MPDSPEEDRTEQNNLYSFHLAKNSCMTGQYTSLPSKHERNPVQTRAATSTTHTATLSPPAGANLCCFHLPASRHSQKECEQLWLRVSSCLAPASNCLKHPARRFDYNDSPHTLGTRAGQGSLLSALLPVKGGWEVAEDHRP